MSQSFDPGAFLIFQLEAGYGLLRVLAHEGVDDDKVWHVTAYNEMFLEVDAAEKAIEAGRLSRSIPHVAMTNRAFESTQTAFLSHQPLEPQDLAEYDLWTSGVNRPISDRSIRLLMGVR
jgi:hypothetical protein